MQVPHLKLLIAAIVAISSVLIWQTQTKPSKMTSFSESNRQAWKYATNILP